ncbi:protein gone early [Culicoides brevitarsis]|uniref:protein gone early n=1 Tax=Culicoides brevitarsis TaxID=469753 RepID=UPI00307C3E0F
MSSPDETNKSNNDTSEDTIPLKNADKSNGSKNSLCKDQSSDATIDINDTTTKERKKNRFIGTYDDVLKGLELTQKSRSTFIALIVVILLLLLTIIILSILWPSIPSYLKYPVCNSKACLETSLQILSWSEPDVEDACDAPRALTCGRFHEEFQEHELYNRYRGEWNSRSLYKYREIMDINNFITKQLVNSTGSGVFIKELYNSCLKLDKTDRDSSFSYLKRVLRSLGGWRIVDDALSKWHLNKWTIKESLPVLHDKFGISLFFKISVRDRDTPPYGKIIAISEGDFGLPHKDLYLIDEHSEIIQSYLEFLANVFKLFDRTSEEAKKFAKIVYNYEKRIVKDAYYLNKEVPSTGEIIQLGRLFQDVSSLAVYDTVKTIFSKTRLSDTTDIWVEDLDKLKEASRIVSSTEASVLNDIVAWSIIKKLLPYLSRDFQNINAQFHYDTYHIENLEPTWYQCTDTVNNFVPVGLEVLRLQNQPRLRTSTQSKEYIQTIFDELKGVVNEEINDAVWISEGLSKYLIDKVSKMSIQIGVPSEVVRDERFLENYYSEYLPQTITFVENVEQLWTFEKTILEKQLGELPHQDELMYEMFPVSGSKYRPVRYSSNLNTLVMQDNLLRHNYFNKDIPISINFARVGTDIAEALVEAIQTLSHRYSNDVQSSKPLPYGTVIEEQTTRCLKLATPFGVLPIDAQRAQLVSLSATKLTKTAITVALNKLKTKDDRSVAQFGHHLSDGDHERLPSLQKYDAHQLFDFVLLQRHCSSAALSYKKLKPFVEHVLAEEETFENLWDNVKPLRKDFDCSSKSAGKCEKLL